MKSLFQSNISWLMLFYLCTVLLTYAMEENKTEDNCNYYSVKKLQHDFTKLMKNPEKYVEFYLNTDNTDDLNADKTYDPNAGGLYKLLPYYQKINILGEKENYAIKWCQFKKEYQLIKVNPLGDSPFSSALLDAEPIATLLKGDEFSRLTNADIKAYTTYEEMKLFVKTLGEKNKELKMRIIEQNKKFRVYALQQKEIIENANVLIKTKTEEHEKALEEVEKLKSNVEEKDKENFILEKQKGGLAYQLSHKTEFEKKFVDLEEETKPLKRQIKDYEIKVKQLEKTSKESEEKIGELEKKLKKQVANNAKKELDRSAFIEYQNEAEKKIHRLVSKQDEQIEEVKRDDRIFKETISEKDSKIKEMKNTISKQVEQIEIFTKKLKHLENEKQAEIKAKDVTIQYLQKTIEEGKADSSPEEELYGTMRCYLGATEHLFSSNKKNFELKKEEKQLQGGLGKKLKNYETPKKRYKDDLEYPSKY